MTTYRKTVHEVLGVKERDIDIITTRASVWETVTSPINIPSNKDLVGHWPLNEGSGMVAYDKSIYSNDGTLVNMEEADWVDGVVGTGLEFDGENDYVRVLDSAQLKGAVFTKVVWFKILSLPVDGQIREIIRQGHRLILSHRGDRTPTRWEIGFSQGDMTGKRWYTPTDQLPLNVWHCVIIVADGSNWAIYHNAVLKASGEYDGTVIDYNYNLWIGAYGANNFGGRNINAIIDEVRIYNCALTASEIKALYLFPSGPTTWNENKIIQKDE